MWTDEREEHYRAELDRMFVSSIKAHARSIEAKDPYTAGHCVRVAVYSELLARAAGGFDQRAIFTLKAAATLHDVGKIGIRRAILCKPSFLDETESLEIQTHPVIGGLIVRDLYGANLEPAVRHHHEQWDGSGYPAGLKGEEIPLESRIILLADTFDAMTSDRPYRRSMAWERALEEIKNFSGKQFDPELVRVMMNVGTALNNLRISTQGKPASEIP
jgi:HD-GYP domain-containing protein (c-di-GMP phosphodiesterase class II)